MAMWKHYIVLFGGFYDPGIKSTSPRPTAPIRDAGGLMRVVCSQLSERPVALRHARIQMEAGRVQGRRAQAIVCPSSSSACAHPASRSSLSSHRPRSGFSFLSTPEGILLHGGYCKEYVKGSRPIGVMLDDTWFLRHVPRCTTLHAPYTKLT